MSHYYYDKAFDFVDSSENFGFVIEKDNYVNSDSMTVGEDYVIEVHYIGDIISTLSLDVYNISHGSGTLNDLYYVEKGFSDSLRTGTDGQLIYDSVTINETSYTATSDIIAAGGTYWGLEQGSLNPHYGLIEIHIPATLTHQQQLDAGNTQTRDHDYLFLEAGLYFDVIQQDPTLVSDLQDLIDGITTIDAFATSLDTATDSIAELVVDAQAVAGGSTIIDASNDVSQNFFTLGEVSMPNGYKLNEVPHMIHFNHVDYYGYDDFSTPTKLNTGNEMNGASETTLIGEFRIDEDTPGPWSFDADLKVYQNTNTLPTYDPIYVIDEWASPVEHTANIYTGAAIMGEGATNTLVSDSNYIVFARYMDGNFQGFELQEAALNSGTSVWGPVAGSAPEPLTSNSGTIYDDFFSSISGSPEGYYTYFSPVVDDLNDSFINGTGSNRNETSVKLTFERVDNGDLSISETVPVINTLSHNSTITFAENKTYDATSIASGTYSIDVYNHGGGTDIALESLVDAGNGYSKTSTTFHSLTGTAADLLTTDINDGAAWLTLGTSQMYFNGLDDVWNVVNISTEFLYYDDGGSKSTDLIPTGEYLVNKIAPDNVTLTKIGPDTDYDFIEELDTSSVYKLYDYNDINYLEQEVNKESGASLSSSNYVLGTDYETADTLEFVMDKLGITWNSVDLDGTNSYATDNGNVPDGHYKVSFDAATQIITLEETNFLDPDYEVDEDVPPYVLTQASSQFFADEVNRGDEAVLNSNYKQYFYDLINTDTVDASETIAYATEYVTLNNGTILVDGQAFDNTVINFINTANVTGSQSLQAGEENDIIAGGVGGFNIDGGTGLDMYLATPTTLKIVTDQNGNITEEGGVKVDLTADRVTYLESNTSDIVSNIEFFMGTLGDDQFIGSARHSTNIDASYKYDIQAFNPTAGKDEIFGAETITDLSTDSPTYGQVIDVQTVVTYDGLEGGQGVIFIMDGSDAAIHAAEGTGEISLDKISQFAGEYWSDTSWAGDGWLPSNEDILNENGHLSTVSKYEVGKAGGTLILDSFGDTDLAFNIDHFIGSGEADIFYGSAGNDSFDAANGTGNYMSGGAGQDQLVVSDQNELESDGASGSQDAGEDLDLDSITINRNFDYTYSNYSDVEIDDLAGSASEGKLITDDAGLNSGDPLYRIDFADVHNLSEFFQSNLSDSLYTVSTEYALFLRTSFDLSGTLPTDINFDTVNQKIDVSGTDISVLDNLSGQLVLAEENAVVEGYIVQGVDNDGNAYNTVIENVEQVSLLSDDVSYFGTGEISGEQEDIYQLIIGGQGDLGEMLYVETGETLLSTTGVGAYSAGANFINGEIYYSGHHTDFDRNTTSPSNWANSVALAFEIAGQDTAKIWNNEVAQFFVWYDADAADGIDGYEIAVKFQNGNINAWGIDNRQFDTFQNVTVDQSIADAINLQFGDSVTVELGEYRILYEAAYTDIETLISSHADVTQWNFDFQPTSSRSTFYIQVGGNATGENGSAGIIDNLVTNVKVERVEVDTGVFDWVVDPQAEILVNLPTLAGATETDNLMISGNSAETIEGGRGSDVMMGRGGSDNYKINAGDTLDANGAQVVGSYGVAGDVINEIGGSSEDKSDSITLSSAKTIDELTFSRTEIASEYWGNTLKIDVAYTAGGTDTLYVFDHYNQNLQSRAVEQLFLDDGWDSNEIWNLIVGDVNGSTGVDEYTGTAGQDVLIAGTQASTLYGGDGQDIMIGDTRSQETTFELGNRDGAWDQVADIIEGFGSNDELDLSALNITSSDLKASNNQLQLASDDTVIAEFRNFNDGLTLQNLLDESGYIDYGAA